jgi:ammonia channel protein AmtB
MKCLGWKCSFGLVLVVGAILLAAAPLFAQQTHASSAAPSTTAGSPATPEIPKSVNNRLEQLDKDVKAAQSSADNAWMLVSAALVLMMTGPGLALFYGGLVRRKNTLALMMQSFALMALITVMWALVGYSLCFGGDGHFIGSFEHAFLRGVGADANPDYAGTAAAAALSWSAAEWIRNGRASALGAISGAVAGLVAITPAAGFVGPMPALAIGLIAGVACYWMVTKVKALFGYDDALDAFGVHGAGGTIGALLTGVLAQEVINPIFGAGKTVGGLDGHWRQVGNQFVGVLIAWVFALVGTLVLLKIVDLLTGIRVPEEHEIEGLDITQHGEEAYNLET